MSAVNGNPFLIGRTASETYVILDVFEKCYCRKMSKGNLKCINVEFTENNVIFIFPNVFIVVFNT